MSNAYCDLQDVKSSLSGDAGNMAASHDQSLVNKILEVSRDIDRKVAMGRGEDEDLFSFLAEQLYGRQIIYVSATPAPTSGTFVLALDGLATGPLAYDASGVAVQSALDAALGAGNALVTGVAGGPWTVDFAGSLTGPQSVITTAAAFNAPSARLVVLPMVQGVLSLYSERRFRAAPDVYGNLLVIDDCLEITGVTRYAAAGASSLTDINYYAFPLRGTPTYALKAVDRWDDWPVSYGVSARWGRSLTVPADVREACVIEVVRSHFSALAGNDDRLGMTPFGSVITSKAFTSKFKELVADYGLKLWWS